MLYDFAKAIILIITKIIFRIKVNGLENIPKQGPCVLCFNHRSLLDPPVLGVYIPRKLSFMAKEELFHIPVLGFLIKHLGAFPVKRGAGDIGAIKAALKILQEGKVLTMYPEGTRMKSGKVGKPKPGVALIATKAQVPVIPIAATGDYKLFHKITINVGKPIVLNEYFHQKLTMEQLQEISNDIMNHIRSLMEVS